MTRLSNRSLAVAALLVFTAYGSSQEALQGISAANLKGDLSFLASDVLQGRYTPSPGLEVAAEFIAAQFRAAGLTPGGDQDYFQIAKMVDRRMPAMQSDMTLLEGSQSTTVPAQNITATDVGAAVNVEHAPVVVFKTKDAALLKGVDLAGKAVVAPGVRPGERRSMDAYQRIHGFDEAVAHSGAAVEITVNQTRAGQPSARLIEAESAREKRVPSLTVASDELQRWIDHAGDKAEARSIDGQYSSAGRSKRCGEKRDRDLAGIRSDAQGYIRHADCSLRSCRDNGNGRTHGQP